MSNAPFNPSTDIPDLAGRVYLVTGGTSGLGAEFISLIAAKGPSKIFISGRSAPKAEALISRVVALSPHTQATFLPADLSSLASVRALAEAFLAHSTRLDVLMCNAGILAQPPALSTDGYELQFATNHLGHALLTKLLLPALLSTAQQPGADVRIVTLSSTAHSTTPRSGIEFATLRTPQNSLGPLYQPSNFTRYGQSKLANLLYARELAARYPSLLSVSVHPGFVRTGMVRGVSLRDRGILALAARGSWVDADKGAWNQTWAATAVREEMRNGAYYTPVGVEAGVEVRGGDGRVLGERLWEWTEQALEGFLGG